MKKSVFRKSLFVFSLAAVLMLFLVFSVFQAAQVCGVEGDDTVGDINSNNGEDVVDDDGDVDSDGDVDINDGEDEEDEGDYADYDVPGGEMIPDEAGKIQGGLEKLQEESEKIKDEKRRKYLAQEWRKMLLKNKFIALLDSFFTKISIVFRVLFGEPYSFSFGLLLVIILWLWFTFKSAEIVRAGLPFKESYSYFIGLALAVAFAQMRVFRIVIDFFAKYIFTNKAWYVKAIIFVGILVVVVLVHYFGSYIAARLKERKKKQKEKSAELAQKGIKLYFRKLRRAGSVA